jgi:N-acetylglucosaminyldiphosphoundecaprenol N-acetyl-beta-D-mannosaminyltransferase
MRHVATPNPEIVVAATRDPELKAILNRTDLAVPDGVGLVWAARRRGADLPGRVAGFDLLMRVLERGSREGLKVFFLGSRPGVAAEAARRCLERWCGLQVAGTSHGYFPPADDEKMARLVAASGAELVAVGMGSPRQEKWIARHRELLVGLVALGVGGSLDVLSGRVRRAPDWMAEQGLEWLGRFITQPERWRRAPALARFVLSVLVEERRMGRDRSSPG